ncbi:MAG TPA: nitrate reductase [Myxococcales bacterium]|nr:nitrate reductase [Deltaproteobacteria bacterium]MBU52946.1 nitrate reductase [Deltaproteobacteria bacterium]HAA55080.1 nitrate reductase [Myxococcales bacterium]
MNDTPKQSPRLPPNQALVAPEKWPVVGERAPRKDSTPWTLTIEGLVTNPKIWSIEELMELQQVERIVDIHCVTRWSKFDACFQGVPLLSLLALCQPGPEATHISFVSRSEHAHHTSLALADLKDLDPLVAFLYDGEPLEEIHGGPIRTVVPGRYFYKSLKWLERIELLAEDRPGTWEHGSGYHNRADPWKEERYVIANIKRSEVLALFQKKDLSHKELLSLNAPQLDLSGLCAKYALLRNANFTRSQLTRADFSHANLSNAHLQDADLSYTNFHLADLEGADFRGANLVGADLRGASLFGATFCDENTQARGAQIDHTTSVSTKQLDALSPTQRAYLKTIAQ